MELLGSIRDNVFEAQVSEMMQYENFSQKGLTFYLLCGIILEQSARTAEKQKSKYRGVEQSGSSSGS
jgi:hypothetical protein